MTRPAKTTEPPADLVFNEDLAAEAAEIEAVIAKAGGARQAVGALLIKLAEVERAWAKALGNSSLGFRQGRELARRLA